MDPRNPPAIVKEAIAPLASLIAQAKVINNEIDAAEKRNLTSAIKLGGILLKMKESCPHGRWEATLAEAEVSSQNASKYMRIAKSRLGGISECKSINEAIAKLPNEQPEPPPQVTSQFCARCQRVGPVKDCEACKALKKGKSAPPREPGDDSEAEAARLKKEKEDRAKQGKERFELKTFTAHLGHAAAELNKLAHEAGLEKESRPGFAPGVIVIASHAECKKYLGLARKSAEKFKEEIASRVQERQP